MYSSAARVAGAPKPAPLVTRNEKNKSNMDAGQRTLGDFAISDPRPPTTELHHKNAGKKQETLLQPARKPNCRGSRSPILPEPAPCHRPWITPQGATPAERLQPYHPKRLSILPRLTAAG